MLGEKALHSAMKFYYEPDASCHEREAFGFIADIKNESGITEIQTRNLFAIKRKLEAYLEETPVTLVHPVIRRRRIIIMDPETGELSRPRLSPKKGRIEDAFSELVHIREALGKSSLSIVIPVVDVEEYRIREAGKKRWRGGNSDLKFELLPTELVSEAYFKEPGELAALLPDEFRAEGREFTISGLAQSLRLPGRTASAMCAVLIAAGALQREKRGRSYYYRTAD